MRVAITERTLAAILDAAAETPEIEVCGLLFGSADRIEAAQATANVAIDPDRMFEIDPAALLAAHRAERGGRERLIGCYHSHPTGGARPSAADTAAAEPGKLWVIVGGGAARLWRAEQDGFTEVELAVVP